MNFEGASRGGSLPGDTGPGESARPVKTVVSHFAHLASTGAWDDLYDGPESAGNVSFRIRLARTTALLPLGPIAVLDVGCGPAPLAQKLPAGSCYTGIDLVGAMLLRARARASRASLVRAGASLPFRDGVFDAVIALGFIEYLEDIPAALREMRRVVRKGGTVIVSTPKRYHLDRTMVQMMTPLRALAGAIWGKRSDTIRRNLMTARELDTLAAGVHLRPSGGTHYHYLPLPYPLTVLAPQLSLRATRSVESWPRRGAFSFIAHGYLGRYERE